MSRNIEPKSILVGIDHGDRDDACIRIGLELAAQFGARLSLVHAIPPPPSIYASVDTTSFDEMRRQAEANVRDGLVEHVREILAERGEGERVDEMLHFVHGPPPGVLIEQAEAANADVIVVGPHQKHALLDFSRTLRGVLAHAPCGVWVQKREAAPIRRILVPLDLSPISLDALAYAVAFAKKFGASITALHCFHELPVDGIYPGYVPVTPIETLEELRQHSMKVFEDSMQAFDWQGVAHEAHFTSGDPVEVMLGRQDEVDLIVLSTHGRSGFSGAVLGDVAYKVIRKVQTPVFALRKAKA